MTTPIPGPVTSEPRRLDVPPMKSGLTFDDFVAYRTINTTTSKLADELAELGWHNQQVSDGDAEPEEAAHNQFLSIPAPAYYHVLQVTHTGGRDWTIIIGLDYPQY